MAKHTKDDFYMTPSGKFRCPSCKQVLNIRDKASSGKCKSCERKYQQEYQVRYSERKARLYLEALDRYGPCPVCGNRDNLVVDPNTQGGTERMLVFLKKRGFPDGYNLVCSNHRK